MKLVRPLTITDTNLVSSTVPEVLPALYSSGTTYALGATAGVLVSGTKYDVYASLQNSNTNHAPASSPTWWKKLGTTYKSWDSSATFAKDDIVIVVGANYHRAFLSLQGSNTNHDPVEDTTTGPGTWWLDMGMTNRWALLDTSITSQTSALNDFTYNMTFTELADTIALLNVAGAVIQIVLSNPTDGTYFDETYDMTSDAGITDYYPYFFEPSRLKRDLIITGLAPYDLWSASITVTYESQTAKTGALIFGLSAEIGDEQNGATIGIRDYSRKEQDDFGNYYVVERSYSKRLNIEVWVDRNQVDYIADILADYRATPALWIGSPLYSSTAVFGFYVDWSIEIDLAIAPCTLEIEGLI